nr:immunoglobulin heavy chain junction region [Macaca mulatta]MOV89128.1 immunoglobulin heavy chain junction region [Macaca mulatta]
CARDMVTIVLSFFDYW